jgi:hypothetical protein
VINADGGYQIEFGIAEGNLQRICLNPGFDPGDLRHHLRGHIAPGRLREIGLQQLEQLTLAATHVQITKARSGNVPEAKKPPNQITFASMEEHRLLTGESISKRVTQQIFVRGRQLVEAGRLCHFV